MSGYFRKSLRSAFHNTRLQCWQHAYRVAHWGGKAPPLSVTPGLSLFSINKSKSRYRTHGLKARAKSGGTRVHGKSPRLETKRWWGLSV